MLLLQPAVQARLVDVSELSAWSGPRIAFWIFGALVLLGALATITRKNPIAAVMSLVATFFGLAATYALLSAHFLSQVGATRSSISPSRRWTCQSSGRRTVKL